MTKVRNNLSFQGELSEIEQYNSSFLKTKCKIFAFGENRNASNITQNSFEHAKKSLAFIPIVAKFSTEKDVHGLSGDLEGHNTVIDIDENGDWVFKYDTFPIGVVSPNANILFEDVNEGTEEEPDVKTYVVVDEVFLWKRYEASKKIEDWLNKGIAPKVSMEIDNVEGKFDDSYFFRIDSFEFQAITALGSDVEPCFPFAQIENYSLIEVKKEFELMLKELKFGLKQEGGENMSEEVVTVEETVEEVVEEVVQETEENFEAVENVEVAEEVVETETVEDVVEEQDATEIVEEFDYKSAYEKLEVDFTSLKTNYETLENEVTSLREFKSSKLSEERKVAETELFERFSSELSDEDLLEVKEKSSDFSLEQLEEKLFTILGKKKATFSKQPKKEKQPTVKVGIDSQEDVDVSPYGNLF